jgi:hypothetical protein
MIIRSTDISEDFGRAKTGFIKAARELGVEFNCGLMTLWRIDVCENDVQSFTELAKQKGKES